MPRKLTPPSTLENLKKEAKRWLKALRESDSEARARLQRADPHAPAEPTLRDIQHALAREHGLPGWTALKDQLAGHALEHEDHAERVAAFLRNACPDHEIRGGPAHVIARHAAERILHQHPELARDSLYTAVVCGELEEVERLLRERPRAACEPGGPKGWEPLLYLCFTRLPLTASSDHAVAIARALLDRGADPNAYFIGGGCRYTPLVGVIGEGEEHRPPHPRREALARLLLERGAEPYDMQVFYNAHFRADLLWFLELIYAQCVQSGRQADWDDPNWSMIDMGGFGFGARFLLGLAVERNDLALAEWLLAHGASPNTAPPPSRNSSSDSARMSQRTLHEEAQRRGFAEMADLLLRFGAAPSAAPLEGEEAFAAACFSLDRAAAQALIEAHPQHLLAPRPMIMAAELDRADVVGFLLDLGMAPDIEDVEHGRQRPLHAAAYHDSVRVAELLIERGAEIDPRDATHQSTPLWFAVWDHRSRAIELLSRFSRDVRSLTFTGNVERLGEVLSAEPDLARTITWGRTLLMELPGDEARALEIAELLLAHGTDPTIRNGEGMSAAEGARRRGMEQVAELLSTR
jgi:ankyrin repeat protein